MAIFGMQGWWSGWFRKVRERVVALDTDPAGQQQWRQLARQATLRRKQVAVLPTAAYGGHKDVNTAWVADSLAVDAWFTPAEETGARLAVPADLHKAWAERAAIMRGRALPHHRHRTSGLGRAPGVPADINDLPRWPCPHACLKPWLDHPCNAYQVLWYDRVITDECFLEPRRIAMATMIDGESYGGRVLIRPF